MARHRITWDVWLEHGENLVIHAENKGSKQSCMAIEYIRSRLSKLYKASEKNQVSCIVDEINQKIDDLDSDIWNRWKGRIRTKKASESRSRRDINESALNYISQYRKVEGIQSSQEILDGLGQNYFIIDSRTNSLLSVMSKFFSGDDSVSLSYYELLEIVKEGLDKRKIKSSPMLLHWSTGKDIEDNVKYEFHPPGESKKWARTIRTDENNNSEKIVFVNKR